MTDQPNAKALKAIAEHEARKALAKTRQSVPNKKEAKIMNASIRNSYTRS